MGRTTYGPRIGHEVDLVQRTLDLVFVASDCRVGFFFFVSSICKVLVVPTSF